MLKIRVSKILAEAIYETFHKRMYNYLKIRPKDLTNMLISIPSDELRSEIK